MNMKPHHFIDIIKLHGAGYTTFTPDEKTGHSFYKVGNEILLSPETELNFTLDCDDICATCKFKSGTVCIDGVSGLGNYTSKDKYNKMIDEKIISYLNLDLTRTYTAKEYCEILYEHKDVIFHTWTLEPTKITRKRYELFSKGCEQYLKKQH